MMKYELTAEVLEEIACCIVDNEMDRDEACEYALSVASECLDGDIKEVERLKREKVELIGLNMDLYISLGKMTRAIKVISNEYGFTRPLEDCIHGYEDAVKLLKKIEK